MAPPVTILLLIDQLIGMAGAEAAFVKLIRNLPADRFRCLAGCFRTDPTFELLREFPCPLHVFPLQRTYDWNAVKSAAQIRHLIRSEHVKIVHTFLETADLWGGAVAKLSGCPILISSRRDMGINRSSKHDLGYRIINRWVSKIHAVSEDVRTYCLEKDGLDASKVVTVYNGIEMEKIREAECIPSLRRSFGLETASHLIITVGHIRQVKGTDILIRAAAQVCRREPRAIFLVIGKVLEPDFFQELRQLAASLGVTDNVKFVGPSGKVFSLLKQCDLFCLLSRSEGLSNALLEAMACGLPCIAADVGGNREVIEDGRSGFLVPRESPDFAADRILHLLADLDRRKQMGQAGIQIIEAKFTCEVMAAKIMKLYSELLSASQQEN